MSAAQIDLATAALADFVYVQRLAPKLMQPELRILLALAGQPEGMTPKELGAAAGIHESLLFKRLPLLVKEGRVAASPIEGAPSTFGKTPMRYRLAPPVEGGAL